MPLILPSTLGLALDPEHSLLIGCRTGTDQSGPYDTNDAYTYRVFLFFLLGFERSFILFSEL